MLAIVSKHTSRSVSFVVACLQMKCALHCFDAQGRSHVSSSFQERMCMIGYELEV